MYKYWADNIVLMSKSKIGPDKALDVTWDCDQQTKIAVLMINCYI